MQAWRVQTQDWSCCKRKSWGACANTGMELLQGEVQQNIGCKNRRVASMHAMQQIAKGLRLGVTWKRRQVYHQLFCFLHHLHLPSSCSPSWRGHCSPQLCHQLLQRKLRWTLQLAEKLMRFGMLHQRLAEKLMQRVQHQCWLLLSAAWSAVCSACQPLPVPPIQNSFLKQ